MLGDLRKLFATKRSGSANAEAFARDLASPEKARPSSSAGEGAALATHADFDAAVDALVDALIRPARAEYGFSDLGPVSFLGERSAWARDDFTLTNARTQRIHGSWWHRACDRSGTVLLYLHGNASSRVEALRAGALEVAVGLGAELVAFDFAGSGWSDGESVSLGLREAEDLADVLRFLQSDADTRRLGRLKVALWGRAMGATAATLVAMRMRRMRKNHHHPRRRPQQRAHPHGEDRPTIAALILDSPIVTVRGLCEDLLGRGTHRLRAEAARELLGAARHVAERRSGADLLGLDLMADPSTPTQGSPSSSSSSSSSSSPSSHDGNWPPTLIVAARGDGLVPPAQSTHLLATAARRRLVVACDGDHSTLRPLWVRLATRRILHAALFNDSDVDDDHHDDHHHRRASCSSFDAHVDTIRAIADMDALVSDALRPTQRARQFDLDDILHLILLTALDRTTEAVVAEDIVEAAMSISDVDHDDLHRATGPTGSPLIFPASVKGGRGADHAVHLDVLGADDTKPEASTGPHHGTPTTPPPSRGAASSAQRGDPPPSRRRKSPPGDDPPPPPPPP